MRCLLFIYSQAAARKIIKYMSNFFAVSYVELRVFLRVLATFPSKLYLERWHFIAVKCMDLYEYWQVFKQSARWFFRTPSYLLPLTRYWFTFLLLCSWIRAIRKQDKCVLVAHCQNAFTECVFSLFELTYLVDCQNVWKIHFELVEMTGFFFHPTNIRHVIHKR